MAFVTCGSCGCPVKDREVECPHCGVKLRNGDGSLPMTAAAILLGLASVTSACDSETASFYGVAGAPGTGGSDVGGAGGAGGDSAGGANTGGADVGGAGGTAGDGGFAAAYGVPASGGAGGGN